jgi:5-methylcytosine-specific restriction endonuclease McrA
MKSYLRKMPKGLKGFQKGHNSFRTKESYLKSAKKISESRKGKKFTEEHRKRLSESHKGKIQTEITRAKLRGRIPWNKGKHYRLSEITKQKMSEAKRRNPNKKMGADNHFWKGGITLGENKREYYRKKCLERVARKQEAMGNHTLGEWLNLKAQYNWTCPACKRKEPEIKLSEDHIIPLKRGGSDNIENIQPLCHSCNSRKHIKIIKFEL